MESTPKNGRNKIITLAVAVVLLAAVALLFISQNKKARQAEEDFNQAVKKLPVPADVRHGDVSASLLGDKVTVKDIEVKIPLSEPITIESMTTDSGSLDLKSIPERFNIKLDGIRMPLTEALFDEAYQDMVDMGFKVLDADLEMDFTWSTPDYVFDLQKLAVSVEDLGALSFSVKISNYDPQKMFLYLFDPTSIQVHHVVISYDDASFFERSLGLAAKREKTTVEALKDEMLKGLDEQIAMAGQEDAQQLKRNLEAVKAFVEKPGRLTVSLVPEKPVGLDILTRLGSPRELVDELNITVSAE